LLHPCLDGVFRTKATAASLNARTEWHRNRSVIVEWCDNVRTLVAGDPSGIDEDDWGRHKNKRLDNWAYKRVMNLVDYKARERREGGQSVMT
jgi:transposase